MYALLSRLYDYPLSREKLVPLLDWASEDDHIQAALAQLQAMLAGVTDWETFVQELNVEYTRLFEGPGFVPAPPYASFYLNRGLLMGPETVAVRRAYLEWNLASVQMGRIPDDHIALELAFMSHLAAAAHGALAEGNRTRLEHLQEALECFLCEHLLTWLPRFCSAVASATRHEFFARLAELTEVLVPAPAEPTGTL